MEIKNTEYATAVFKPAFEFYKNKNNNNKELNKQQRMVETAMKDYAYFNRIHKVFDMLNNVIKFLICSDEQSFVVFANVNKLVLDIQGEDPEGKGKNNAIDDINKLILKPLKSLDDVIMLYNAYPNAIDIIKVELYEIINLDKYELFVLFRKVNVLLYYSTIADDEKLPKILISLEKDIIEFEECIKKIIKKVLRLYIQLLVKNNKKS